MNLLTELIAARARMAERRHIRRNLYLRSDGVRDSQGGFYSNHVVGCCIMGALQEPDAPLNFKLKEYLDNVLDGDIMVWNDARERTKADVFALLDKAIA